MAFFKGQATDYHDMMDVIKNLAKDDHISVAAVLNGGVDYAVGDTITLAAGTKYHEPEIEVTGVSSGDYISNAVVAVGGSSYNVGDELYPVGGTFSVGAVLEVTGVSGGAVTTVQINNPGICSAQPSNPVSTTSDGGGTGCTLTLTFTAGTGILTAVHIADAGVYTSQANNPVLQNTSSGSGTGAKFTVTYLDTAWATKIDHKPYEATAVAISAAGTGYTANDIVTIVGGSFTVAATVKILTVSAGVPQTVEVHTEVGDYISTPSNPAVTSGGTGSGLTLTMTWTYTVLEHKYLILHNTNTDQFIGWKASKETSPETAYLLQNTGFTGFNSVSTPWDEQPGATTALAANRGTYTPLSGGGSPATIYYWINIQDLRITAAFKVASVYPNMYLGGIDPDLTEDEYAYPQYIAGCIARRSPYTYGGIDFCGMNNPGVWAFGSPSFPGPGWLRKPDGNLRQVFNWAESSGNPSYSEADINITPVGGTSYASQAAPNAWYLATDTWREMFDVTVSIEGTQNKLVRVNDDFILLPCTLVSRMEDRIFGNMIGVFCFNPDGTINAEDRIWIGSTVYRCFQNCNKSNRNYFFAIREN